MAGLLRITKEEGHYTLKRVDKLPKRGNYNILYALKSIPLTILYRYLQNGTYEEIPLGDATSITNTSQLVNDGETGASIYVESNDLSLVATTGNYSDLLGLPTIPTIPTLTSAFTNNGSDGNSTYVELDELATVAISGNYSDLIGLPTIPTPGILSVVAGTNVTVDATDPLNPIVSSTGGGTPTGLELITEGINSGWRFVGANPTLFGNIGANATDLSFSPSASSTRGATGNSSLASGYQVTASGNFSAVTGIFNTASGNSSFATGTSTVASGQSSFTAGASIEAPSFAEITLGYIATTYTPASTSTFNTADRAFTVGIGLNSATPRDGLRVIKNGEVLAPEATTAIIDAADDKVLVTKEWVEANVSTGGNFVTTDTVQTITATKIFNGNVSVTGNGVTGNGANSVQNFQKISGQFLDIIGGAGVWRAEVANSGANMQISKDSGTGAGDELFIFQGNGTLSNDDNIVRKKDISESGIFVPTLIDVGSGATFTFTVFRAEYKKVSDLIYVNVILTDVESTSVLTGDLLLGGMPFSAGTSTQLGQAFVRETSVSVPTSKQAILVGTNMFFTEEATGSNAGAGLDFNGAGLGRGIVRANFVYATF